MTFDFKILQNIQINENKKKKKTSWKMFQVIPSFIKFSPLSIINLRSLFCLFFPRRFLPTSFVCWFLLLSIFSFLLSFWRRVSHARTREMWKEIYPSTMCCVCELWASKRERAPLDSVNIHSANHTDGPKTECTLKIHSFLHFRVSFIVWFEGKSYNLDHCVHDMTKAQSFFIHSQHSSTVVVAGSLCDTDSARSTFAVGRAIRE